MYEFSLSLILAYEGLVLSPLETFLEHQAYSKEAGLSEGDHRYTLEIIYAHNNDIKNIDVDTDVIISRGLTAELLKRHPRYYNTPVVEIPVAGNDLTRCIVTALETYGKSRIGVIGSQNMIYETESLSKVFHTEIKSYRLHDQSQCEEKALLAKQEGCTVIIGGATSCDYAQRNGLNAIILCSGKEALWQSLNEAKRMAILSRREQEKAKRIKAILDFAHEGIISTDNRGQILTFNTAAQKLLGINRVPSDIAELTKHAAEGRFREITSEAGEIQEEIFTYLDSRLVVNKIPIVVRSQNAGSVITISSVSDIQQREGMLRKKIYHKGLTTKYDFTDLAGNSPRLKETIELARKFSRTNGSVLLFGQTGTGKEIFAQSIHNSSQRRYMPFVAVNCAAIPENLIESELFGYTGGAFTGASKGGKEGYFELAHQGTIFLDEISELRTNVQCRLLRVLQEKEIMRIGDNRVIPIDVRIISASNKDLFDLVKKGEFREDLYYRLNVVSLKIPSLSQRREDIPLLTDHFFSQLEKQLSIKRPVLSIDSLEKLKKHRWHGNIRELQNVCERMLILYSGEIIKPEMIEPLLDRHSSLEADNTSDFQHQVTEVQKEIIIQALSRNNYSRSKTAQQLGISRATLYRYCRKQNISNQGSPD